MINYQTLLKKVLVRVSYTNWLLRTTTNTHRKYSSYSLLLIRTQATHFVFGTPSNVKGNRKVTHVQCNNYSALDWFAFPCTILSRCHTQDCSRKEERLLLACRLLQNNYLTICFSVFRKWAMLLFEAFTASDKIFKFSFYSTSSIYIVALPIFMHTSKACFYDRKL